MSIKKVFTNIVLSVFTLTMVGANVSYALAPTLSDVHITPGQFDPNAQELSITGDVDSKGYLTIQVFDINEKYLGNVVYYKYIDNPSEGVNEKWDGTDRNNDLVQAGWYKLVITFNNNNGRAREEGWVQVEYGAEPNPAPELTNVDASPDPFDPTNNESTTISYTLSETSDVTLSIYQGTSLIRNLLTTSSKSSGNHTETSWDGRDMNGQIVSEGSYKYYIVADDQVTEEFDTAQGYVQVLYEQTVNPDPNVYNVNLTPATIDIDNNEITTMYYAIENCGDIDVEVYENGSNSLVSTLRSNDYLCDVYYSDVWNGRNSNGEYVDEGSYYIEVSASKDGSVKDSERRYVVVEDSSSGGGGGTDPVPVITNESANPATFDPTDNETTKLTYTLNTDATVSVKVYDVNDNEVDNLGTYSKSSGTYSDVSWDGEDSSNNIVDEGLYYMELKASNSAGDDVERVYVSVDYDGGGSTGTAPQILNEYVTLNEFDPAEEATRLYYTLNTEADVTVKIYEEDDDGLVKTLLNDETQNAGTHSLNWNGDDSDGDDVDEGDYYFEIEAENAYGFDRETVDVTVEEDGSGSGSDDIRIRDLELSPDDEYNPDDGSLRIEFELESDKCADLDLWIEDEDGDKVRDIEEDERICDGNHYYRWYGTDEDGDEVDEDDYVVVVRVSNSDGSDREEETIEVDYDADNDDDDDDNYIPEGERCAGYTDVHKDDPYCDAIQFAKSRGIFDGYPDGSFRPYRAINRAETTKVILKGFNKGIMSADGTNLGFYDVSPNAWYMPYLRTAKQLGIIQGYPDGSFQPARTVNKVEMLKIFLETANAPLTNCTYQPYSDTPTDVWYSRYVCYAAQHSLMEADVYGNVSPAQLMTRGDVAVLFYNYYNPGTSYYNTPNYYNYYDGYDYDDYYYNDYEDDPRLSDVDVRDDTVDQGDNVYIEYSLNTCADVTIRVYDEDDDLVKELADEVRRCSGDHTIVWDGEDEDNDEVDEGEYTIEIEAENSEGDDKEEVDVEIEEDTDDEDPRLSNVELRDDDVPRGSTVYIDYEINTCADITIKVYDEDDDLVKTILNDSRKCEGEYTKSWNQKDDDNYTVVRGDYLIEVIAENDAGRDSEELDLEVE